MPAPAIQYVTLAQHVTKFAEIREADGVPGRPIPDLQAARYSLTGWNPESTYITGINTAANLIGEVPEADLPAIRRDYDSLIGFTKDCPVSTAMMYFPNPPPSRTQSKPLHIRYECRVGIQVSSFLYSLEKQHWSLTLYLVFRFNMLSRAQCPTFCSVHLVLGTRLVFFSLCCKRMIGTKTTTSQTRSSLIFTTWLLGPLQPESLTDRTTTGQLALQLLRPKTVMLMVALLTHHTLLRVIYC